MLSRFAIRLKCVKINYNLVANKRITTKFHHFKFNLRGFSSDVILEPKYPSVPATKVEYLQKLLFLQHDSPKDARVLKVAVVGCPNCGKSSLVNMLTKWRVCAVAGKAHTTRSKQLASLVQDNIQVVFVDLPGLVNNSKIWDFNLEKSFIRDPHSAIFESDIILVVVDVTHKYSRLELDQEIVKILHYFTDKESVLVLNKIDKLKNNPTMLLDVTRRLTGGIVHGRCSHTDRYMARFQRRAKLSASTHQLIPPSELISSYLPPVCHEHINKFLKRMDDIQMQLNSSEIKSVNPSEKFINDVQIQMIESESKNHPQNTDGSNPLFLKDRDITAVEIESINEYFNKYEMQNRSNSETQKTETPMDSSTSSTYQELETVVQEDNFDTMLDKLKSQLLLKSADPQEVAIRRKHWLKITNAVKGIKQWQNFSEVFMVSSTFGHGIDKLRDYLISKALPNRKWILPSTLITDQEPTELVRMCVWAHCLNKLHQEIPYSLHIIVDDCDKAKMDDGDDRIYVHARIQCQNERQLKYVLGPGGCTIKEIATATKLELMTMFRADTVVKLTAQLSHIPSNVKKQLRTARDFSEVLPEFGRDN